MFKALKVVPVGLFLVAALLPDLSQAEASKAEQANAAAIAEMVTVLFNEGKVARAGEFLQSGFVDHSPWPEQSADIAGFKAGLQAMRESFPDLHVSIERTVAQDNMITAHLKMTGTQKGAFMGAPASNKSFSIDAIDMVRMDNGRIVEHWGLIDTAALAAQLGL